MKDMYYCLACISRYNGIRSTSCGRIYQPKRLERSMSLTRRFQAVTNSNTTESLYFLNTTRLSLTTRSFIAAPDPNAFFPDQFDANYLGDVPFGDSALEGGTNSDSYLLSSMDQYQSTCAAVALVNICV